MNILYRVRKEGREAVVREIESWKAAHEEAMRAWQIEELVCKAVVERQDDARFLRRVLENAAGDDKQRIDEANEFVQGFCDRSITIHDLLRSLIAMLSSSGHQIAGAEKLDEATEAYRKWKEDFPELLAMAYTPLTSKLRERIAVALNSSPSESNWEEFFENEKP